jgi:hypothetical protein
LRRWTAHNAGVDVKDASCDAIKKLCGSLAQREWASDLEAL